MSSAICSTSRLLELGSQADCPYETNQNQRWPDLEPPHGYLLSGAWFEQLLTA